MLVPREYRTLPEVRSAIGGRMDRAHIDSLFDRLDWFETLHPLCLGDTPLRVFQQTEDACEAWLFLLAPSARRLTALANWYSFALSLIHI